MKYLTALFVLIFGFTCTAQEPESDAVFQKITKEYTLNGDGSVEYRYYKKLKLLTHFSFNRLYGETFITYNPDYQDLKINIARVIHDDGEITEAPVNAFNEVLPHFAAHAPAYNNLREMVVTHSGTAINAVIELDYTITTKPGFYPGLMGDEVLTESSPVQEEEIILRAPDAEKLNFKMFNIKTVPEIVDDGKVTSMVFTFKNIPENSHERNQPDNDLYLPRLIFSNLSWDDALKYVFEQNPWNYKTDEDMQSTVDKVRKENAYDLPFILQLNKIIADNVNHYAVPWAITGYNARQPIDTWQSNGGTDFEKTLLFVAMLRQGGINANPVLVIPEMLFDPYIGCLPLVNRFLVQANPRDLEQMYLSAIHTTDQNEVYKLNGNVLFTLGPVNNTASTIKEKFENKVVTNGTIIFNDTMSYSGNLEYLLTEAANPYYSIEEDSTYIRKMMNGISENNILSSDLINSAQFRTLAKIDFEISDPLSAKADNYTWEMPVNKQGIESWHIQQLSSERVSPFEIPNPVNEQYNYTVSLPSGKKLVNPVELTDIKKDFGELIIYIGQKENKVTIKKMLWINRRIILREEYKDFKNMMDLWNDAKTRELILN